MSEVSGDLVAHALGGHDSNLIHNTFIGVEVKCEAVVVLLDDLARSALDGLGADASPVECKVNREEGAYMGYVCNISYKLCICVCFLEGQQDMYKESRHRYFRIKPKRMCWSKHIAVL